MSTVQNLSDRDLIRIVHDGIQSAGCPGSAPDSTMGRSRLSSAIFGFFRVDRRRLSFLAMPRTGVRSSLEKRNVQSATPLKAKAGLSPPICPLTAGTHTAAEMEHAITEPNKFLDPRQRTVVVVTRDGKKLSGVARNEDNFSLQLQTLDGAFHMLDKSDLARLERQPRYNHAG